MAAACSQLCRKKRKQAEGGQQTEVALSRLWMPVGDAIDDAQAALGVSTQRSVMPCRQQLS